MKNQFLAVALLSLAGTTAALAAPQETFDYVTLNGAPLIGTGALGAGNSIVTATSTGAYTARAITLAGNVGAWGAGTWGSESRIQLTLANGTNLVFGPFSTLTSTPPGPVAFTYTMNIAAQDAAGNWTVQPYETYNDPVDDATYDALTLTLDDGAIPVGAPATFTDLGDFTLANRTSDTVINLAAGNEVVWFKMKLPAVAAATPGYVDIYATNLDPTQPVGANELDDTDLALYNATSAQLVNYDDLTGPGYFGQLSYGSNIARPATVINGQTAGAAFTGQSGTLAEGFYYLAVGQYPMVHPTDVTGNWASVTSTYAGTRTDTVLHIRTQLNNTPYPPVSTASSATPGSAAPGETVVFTVTVNPGGNPASTGLNVHGDLTAIGGGSSVLFNDDGLNGDATAGDNIFSYSYAIPAATAGGNYSVPFTIADAQARSGSGTITGSVFNPEDLGQIGAGAGGTEVVTTHDVTVGGAGEVQWFKFSIGTDVLQGSTNYLDIDTEPTADDGTPAVGSINDTEIGVYDTVGTLMGSDDDAGSNYHSQLSFGDNTNIRPAFGNGTAGDGRNGDLAAGTYFLAGGLFNVTYAANFVVTCTSATASGTYQLNFRTNIPGGGTGNLCGPADLAGTGGVPGADGHLDNNDFVVFIDYFFNHNALADQGSTGGIAGSDGVWDNNDFVVFIDNFFNAPASCR